MALLFFHDIEASDLIDWQKPSGLPHQPHIVQVAAILADEETGEIIESMDRIVIPDGWSTADGALKIHGITMDRAIDEGIPEKVALEEFLSIRSNHGRVAFSKGYQQRMIRIALKRFSTDDEADRWAEKDDYQCTAQMAKKAMGVKKLTLVDAYKHFTGKDLENAHTAMADTQACMEIYFAMKAIS